MYNYFPSAFNNLGPFQKVRFTSFNSPTVINGDTMKAIQPQLCVIMLRLRAPLTLPEGKERLGLHHNSVRYNMKQLHHEKKHS